MPGLMMPQVKCGIRNAVKEISTGTGTAERGGVAAQPLWFMLPVAHGAAVWG